MRQAPFQRRVWDSSNARQWTYSPVRQSVLPTYPLKPSHAGEPSRVLLRTVVEIGKLLLHPEGSEFALLGQPPTAFHETHRVSTPSHKV